MKMKEVNFITGCLVAMVLTGCGTSDFTSYVDPFIGTDATGHTTPSATTPFGMVQAGPDTGTSGWARSSGYHASDSTIMGFAQTHLSGTGASDMGDIMIMPLTGEPQFDPGPEERPDDGYRSRFRHETEKACPGYYSVHLDDYAIDAEMTASQRCAFYRFSCPEEETLGLMVDLEHGIGDYTKSCNVQKVSDYAIEGHRRSSGFVSDHAFWFYAEFSEPIIKETGYFDWEILQEPADSMSKMFLDFGKCGSLMVKIGLSTVSSDAARANLEAEIPHWNFQKTVKAAKKQWNDYLSRIAITSIDDAQDTVFYTAMYHSMSAPNLVTDVDGSYRGWDDDVYGSAKGDLYTNFSLWDTYRAVHPYYALLYPEKNSEFINSFIERYRQIGFLPVNEYGSCETWCMIGYHAIPVIADAIMMDEGGFDYEEAFEAMKSQAMDDGRGVGLMKEFGYIPSELENNSVSKLLEYAYDDWCIAKVAEKLGYEDDYKYFINRARNWKNVLDPETGFMRGRHADGSWVTPFDPRAVSVLGQGDFTEGNSWQYSFYVPHDMSNFIKSMGGDSLFTSRLYTLFITESGVDNKHAVDVTGLIGQYAQGNEPSHHAAYLFNFSGEPWKTQEIVSRIKNELYFTGRSGLCGNDDCGQMSCWYIYSTLGFYPVTPCSGYYVIGSPSVKYARISLPDGKTFEISAPEASPGNVYIQSVKLNGVDYDKSWISIDDIRNGGRIEFTMGSTPNKTWGVSTDSRPVSQIKD